MYIQSFQVEERRPEKAGVALADAGTKGHKKDLQKGSQSMESFKVQGNTFSILLMT